MGLLKGFAFLQRNSFKVLTEAFDKADNMQNGERIPEFYFGQIRLRNVMQMSEDSNSLAFKTWFVPAFRIPFSAFSEIREAEGMFKKPIILLQFKNEKIAPLQVVLSDEQRKMFPQKSAWPLP